MLLRISASKDTFITNKQVRGVAVTGSNAGASEVLQLFKTVSPAQVSNALIAFPTASALQVFSGSQHSGSISWVLTMKNVETENPNAGSFNLEVRAMQVTWDEGKGHDIDYWTDKGFANYSYARAGYAWADGARPNITGTLVSATVHFDTGHEDLEVDVSEIMSMSFIDSFGFWIGFPLIEMSSSDDYYLKAFRSRHTHFPQYQPYLEARWNDFTGSYTSAFTDVVDATGVLVGGIYNLKSVYDRLESPILRTYFRPKDWNLSVVTTGSSDVSGTVLTNAYYQVVDNFSEEVLIPFGTGSAQHTRMSYNDMGNYFKFPMQNLVPGMSYRFDIGYYDIEGTWNVMRDEMTFRVK